MPDEKENMNTMMKPNRIGKCTEYKDGHYYLTRTQWEDGHEEIEIHVCVPQMLWHTCDPDQFEMAKEKFSELTKTFPLNEKIIELLPRVVTVTALKESSTKD